MTTRIVLYALPPVLARAVQSELDDQPDLVLVGRPDDEVGLLLDCPAADLVVSAAGPHGCHPATVERLLGLFADICVLALDWDSHRAWTYRNEGTQHELPARSLDDLAATIRAVAAPTPPVFDALRP